MASCEQISMAEACLNLRYKENYEGREMYMMLVIHETLKSVFNGHSIINYFKI